MPSKAPGIFSKKIKEKDFSSKILKKTFSEKDNEFLLAIFKKDAGNNYSIDKELSKEEVKHLAKILKNIKGNTGIVLKGRLAVLLVLICGIAVFYAFFKDALLENALESGLQSLFSAKSEVSGFSFDVFAPRMGLAHLAIADKNKPMTNLIELGNTEIHLDMAELLKGRFRIKNIEVMEIQFATQRKTSGALAVRIGEGQKTNKEESSEKKDFSLSLKGVDFAKLLSSQKDKLSSTKAIEEGNKTFSIAYDKWKDAPGAVEKQTDELEASVKSVLAIKPQAIKTIGDAENAIRLIENAAKISASLKSDLEKKIADAGADTRLLDEERKKIESAISADKSFLMSFLSVPKGGASELASEIVRGLLSANLGDLYGYSLIAFDAAARLAPGSKVSEKKPGPQRHGRTVTYPSANSPAFLIEKAEASIGAPGKAGYISASLRNVSSEPELTGSPLLFDYYQKTQEADIIAAGSLDTRTGAVKRFFSHVQLENAQAALSEGLGAIGLSRLSGSCTLVSDFGIDGDGSFGGSMIIALDNMKAERISGADRIAQMLADIIAGAGTVKMSIDYKANLEGRIEIKAKSSLDSLVAKSVGKLLDDAVKEASSSVEKELNGFLKTGLEENKSLDSSCNSVFQGLSGSQKSLSAFDEQIAGKKKEIEAQAKKLVGGDVRKTLEKLFK